MTYFKWQDKHVKFLKENANGNNSEDLTQSFNNRFGTNQSKSSLKSKMYQIGIKFNNNTGRFKKVIILIILMQLELKVLIKTDM